MDEWNKLSEKHWDYWEYYRDMYDFSLSKGANSLLTKVLYPVFYQEKLLKREFVKNMQLLGELKPEEISEYEGLRKKSYLHNVYNYYSKPTGWYFGYVNWSVLTIALFFPYVAYKSNKSISWYVMPSLLFLCAGTFATYHILRLNFSAVIDMTQWALEQRKAKVWVEEKNHPTAKLAPLPELRSQILALVNVSKP